MAVAFQLGLGLIRLYLEPVKHELQHNSELKHELSFSLETTPSPELMLNKHEHCLLSVEM